MSIIKSDSTHQATLIGILAPICWGMGVSLVRGIAEGFGLAQGQTLLYLTAAICLFFTIGIPDFSKVDKRYLFIGLPTANASSLCFCLAIFFSSGGAQTMEVAMVNYLWPSLTLLFAVLFNGVRTRWWIVPGILLGFFGIVHILAGSDGFSLEGFLGRILEHPLSYILALGAALTWAGFSSMTRAWGGNTNLSTVIFTINMLIYGTLWLCGFGTETVGEVSQHGIYSAALPWGAPMPPGHSACRRETSRSLRSLLISRRCFPASSRSSGSTRSSTAPSGRAWLLWWRGRFSAGMPRREA